MGSEANKVAATGAIILTIPGLFLNTYCASHFRRRMHDNNGRTLIPFFTAFVQTSLDCASELALIICNSGYFLLVPETPLFPFLCILTNGSLFDMCLGMRAVTNLVIATFNYIKLLCPFTTSPLPFRELILIVVMGTVTVSAMPVIWDITQLNTTECMKCVPINSSDKSKHRMLMVGHLICLYSFVYLYLLPSCGTVYLYRKTIITLEKNHGGEGIGDEAENNSEDNVLQLVLAELEKALMLDGVVMTIFFAIVFLVDFKRKFYEAAMNGVGESDSTEMQIRRIFVSTYSTFYICASLIRRRVYRGPSGELAKIFICKSH